VAAAAAWLLARFSSQAWKIRSQPVGAAEVRVSVITKNGRRIAGGVLSGITRKAASMTAATIVPQAVTATPGLLTRFLAAWVAGAISPAGRSAGGRQLGVGPRGQGLATRWPSSSWSSHPARRRP
jgi:hypothetical protein